MGTLVTDRLVRGRQAAVVGEIMTRALLRRGPKETIEAEERNPALRTANDACCSTTPSLSKGMPHPCTIWRRNGDSFDPGGGNARTNRRRVRELPDPQVADGHSPTAHALIETACGGSVRQISKCVVSRPAT
jgi:hypothetical protein